MIVDIDLSRAEKNVCVLKNKDKRKIVNDKHKFKYKVFR